MYDFFSIPGVYIDNRGQSLYPFLYVHIFSRILDSPQSRQSAKPFLQSSELGPPTPSNCLQERGGEFQFGRGDRHCGSLGICVLCGTASLENLPNKFCKNPRNLRVCGRLLMCFPAIESIAGEHM
jgi:hypothetical protein